MRVSLIWSWMSPLMYHSAMECMMRVRMVPEWLCKHTHISLVSVWIFQEKLSWISLEGSCPRISKPDTCTATKKMKLQTPSLFLSKYVAFRNPPLLSIVPLWSQTQSKPVLILQGNVQINRNNNNKSNWYSPLWPWRYPYSAVHSHKVHTNAIYAHVEHPTHCSKRPQLPDGARRSAGWPPSWDDC